jgi:hypothetical protein
MIRWYAREDSNLWPLAPEASALSAELRAQVLFSQLYRSSWAGMPANTVVVRAGVGSGILRSKAATIGRLSRRHALSRAQWRIDVVAGSSA